ncbi:MAG: hypothetical protein AB7I50_01645 [Vicinamibacterales bacterium]
MSARLDSERAAERVAVISTIDDIRRRWFWRVWLRVATETILVAGAATGLGWAIGYSTPVLSPARAAVGIGVLAVVVGFAAWRGTAAARRRPTDRQVARFIEERVPELDDVLVSAVDCLERPHPPLMEGLLMGAARAALHNLDRDRDRIVARAQLVRSGAEMLGAAVVLGILLLLAREAILDTWFTTRMALWPPVLTFEVDPGNATLREGDSLKVRARLRGLPERLSVEPLRVEIATGHPTETRAMSVQADWHEVLLDGIHDSFHYTVTGYGHSSDSYRVDVRARPRVERIELHYEFPRFSGLPPHVEPNGGDIYAPAGTNVRLVVHTTAPVRGATVGLSSGPSVTLAPSSDRTIEGSLVVTRDDAYRVVLNETAQLTFPDDTEYFIRTVADRPPDVRIIRPAADRKVTRLEEVTVEARADDDFGVDQLELVYSARGEPGRVVRIGKPGGQSVTGRHTVFVEDLAVQPGDFITYYARARDVGRGKRPSEVRSDIYFLEVRPFNEEFEAAQSSAMAGQGGEFDDLAARQKEIIIATWKIERRSTAGQSATDIRALAGAQAELKARTEQLANRLNPRSAQRRRVQPSLPGVPSPQVADDPLRRAVEAMQRSAESLQALRVAPAIPHEMEALNALLKAEAEVTRRQVAQQQSASGRGGQSGNQDLSALFDQELQRQQQTKYENRQSVESQGRDEPESDALQRLRELARRQDDLSRRQQELARRRAELSAAEVKRQLEVLSREQQELRRQAEELAAQMERQDRGEAEQQARSGTTGQESQSGQQSSQGQQGQAGQGQQGQSGNQNGQASQGRAASGTSDSGAVEAAARSMGEAAGRLSSNDVDEAMRQAQRAAERLRQAERSMADRQPGQSERMAADLQVQALQLAEAERQLARQLRDGQRERADDLRRMAGQQERAAAQAQRMGQRARELAAMNGAGQRAAATRPTADGATEAAVEAQLRESARALRAAAEGAGGTQATAREAERAEEAAGLLEARARELGAAGAGNERAQLSEQLARAGELRERLAELSRQVREGGRPDARATSDQGPSGQRGSPQSGTAPGNRDEGRGASPNGGGQPTGTRDAGQAGGSGGTNASAADIERELRALGRLADGLPEGREDIRRALDSLQGLSPGRSAPGTEAWKQDFAQWEGLRRAIAQSLEQIEAAISDRVRAEERENRLDSGASDSTPDAYQQEVARYYRSLARRPPS